MALGVLIFPYIENVSLFDLIDFVVSIVAQFGLYGFAFYTPIGTLLFWRYFFYFLLIESILFVILLPILGVQQYGQPTRFDGTFVFELGFVLLILRAVYFYAYRRPFIWARSS